MKSLFLKDLASVPPLVRDLMYFLHMIPTITWEKRVRWTPHSLAATIEYVSIDHCGLQTLMAEQFLHRPDIIAVFE